MKNPREILLAAAELGRKVGVAMGEFHRPDGSMCINGLIGATIKGSPINDPTEYRVLMDSDQMQPITEALLKVIPVQPWHGWGAVANWNNELLSSERQICVIAALEAAAELV